MTFYNIKLVYIMTNDDYYYNIYDCFNKLVYVTFLSNITRMTTHIKQKQTLVPRSLLITELKIFNAKYLYLIFCFIYIYRYVLYKVQ